MRDVLRTGIPVLLFVLIAGLPAAGEEPAEENAKNEPAIEVGEGEKLISGMSIVGNDEAPKSLVIVPWKSSELGNTLDVSNALLDGRDPVDRDVFMRELTYYRIRSGKDD